MSSRLLSLTAGPELKISRREEKRRAGRPQSGATELRGYGEWRPGGCLGEMRWSLQTQSHSAPCLMEEVEISQWPLVAHWTGGKSVCRLPSEYDYGIISQTKSRLGARRSRDERTEKPDRASSFVTDITLPSSPLIRTEDQHWQSDRQTQTRL